MFLGRYWVLVESDAYVHRSDDDVSVILLSVSPSGADYGPGAYSRSSSAAVVEGDPCAC